MAALSAFPEVPAPLVGAANLEVNSPKASQGNHGSRLGSLPGGPRRRGARESRQKRGDTPRWTLLPIKPGLRPHDCGRSTLRPFLRSLARPCVGRHGARGGSSLAPDKVLAGANVLVDRCLRTRVPLYRPRARCGGRWNCAPMHPSLCEDLLGSEQAHDREEHHLCDLQRWLRKLRVVWAGRFALVLAPRPGVPQRPKLLVSFLLRQRLCRPEGGGCCSCRIAPVAVCRGSTKESFRHGHSLRGRRGSK
mmetsp:Transcript_6681/g.14565  ORF Transcript_6681/g.14565 Transcript_6681/m.14565 type:complete len:249 (-) Transcript_6681:1091-1837(-)